ncbi:MAG: DEAD/DEAH box helicase [Caldilinea sp.]|nr:DEAD/DEAH box helicase [Caldilinea sp.]MCB9122786.1 DEAD/DEAH box helicase [Caldilineaceae bacterium]MCB9124233.1 DEAD/DEAH box helicase [Caldilineaceae bacterium]MCO5210262.1 DEAD/DEAH box helicase [Caldilinea sp.]MCW5840668.1 DEAD/DEAH box helicase [Caldilinea sp.]
MTTAFSHLGLHPELVQAVEALGFTTPTPIQSAMIPVMLEGHDVIGQAQTGTGKTAAFALPILHRLEPGGRAVQSLVLVPTRELAVQVAKAMHDFGRERGIRVLPVYGGEPYGRQISRLNKGVDVVVGTPGRLLDLIQREALDLSEVETVVLDEADEMLSMGFIEDIESILSATPAERQTALLSATVPPEIRRLADRYLRQPQSVAIEREQVTVSAIEQRHYLVYETDKLAALTRLFEVEPITSALIFVRTRAGTGELAAELSTRGFPAEALSGELEQEERERVMNRFRRNLIKVLVATDVAARGLDIDHISHVFNFDLPEDPEVYVHRIGRTGRAGKSGTALSLVTPNERWRLGRIEGFIKTSIARAALPTTEEIYARRDANLLERVGAGLIHGRLGQERALATTLVDAGYDPVEIAAAALRLARGGESQRPILPVNEVQERRPQQKKGRHTGQPFERQPRQRRPRGTPEAGMVSLSLSKGKVHGVRPADVVSTIAHHANIPGHAIGRIYIQDNHTLVDVPEQFVAQVLARSANFRIHRQTIDVARA